MCNFFFVLRDIVWYKNDTVSSKRSHSTKFIYIFFTKRNNKCQAILEASDTPVICLYRYGMCEISLIKSESNCESTSSQINLHSIILLNYAFSFAEGI